MDIIHCYSNKGFFCVKCDECFKSFTTYAVLLEHKKIKHNKAGKRFQCSQCSYSSSKKFNLQQHILVHTGEKPHKCHICNKSFQQRSGLKNHILRHSDDNLLDSLCE